MAATTVAAIVAATFIGSLGINTHVDYTTGAYANRTITKNAINYLGVKNLRDCPESSRSLTIWPDIAAATGAKFIAYMPRSGPTEMQQALNRVPQLKGAGVLNYIEGANEPDTPPAISAGNSLSYSAYFQQKVYATGRSLGLKVINLSVGAGWTSADGWQGNYDSIGDLSAYADFANGHTYPAVSTGMPYKTVARINELSLLGAPNRRIFISELGWNTAVSTQTTVAKNLLNGLMDAALLGNAKTYVFALFDDGSGKWGVMNPDGTPRPAGKALRNLVTLLKDAGSIAPGSLTFELTGIQTERRVLFRKSDGAYWLAIWDEVAGARTVTLNLASTASSIKVYDPTNTTTPIQSVSNSRAVSLSVNDRPLLIRIALGTTAASAEQTFTTQASAADKWLRVSRLLASLKNAFSFVGTAMASETSEQETSAKPEPEAFLPDARAMPAVPEQPNPDPSEAPPIADLPPGDASAEAMTASAPDAGTPQAEEVPPEEAPGNVQRQAITAEMPAAEPVPEGEVHTNASAAQATAGATKADGSSTQTGAANDTPSPSVIYTKDSNTVIAASLKTELIYVSGTGDTIKAGPSTTTVNAFSGNNTIYGSSGKATFTIAGTGNTINIGTGATRIEDNGQGTTIVFNTIGAGQTDLYGPLGQGTKLNFARLLAGTEWDGKPETVGNFLKVSSSGTTSVVSVVPSGLADGVSHPVVALPNASNLTLDELLQHAILTNASSARNKS